MVCGVSVVSALTESRDPWHMAGNVAWELETPVPCVRGVFARGSLGVWSVSEAVLLAYRDGVRARHASMKARV